MKRLICLLTASMAVLMAVVCCRGVECETCDEGQLVSVSVTLNETFYQSAASYLYVYAGDVLYNRYEFTGKNYMFDIGTGSYDLYIFNGVGSLPMIPESVAALLEGVPNDRYRILHSVDIKPVPGGVIAISIN